MTAAWEHRDPRDAARRHAETTGYPTVAEFTAALELLADPYWGDDIALTLARGWLQNIPAEDLRAHMADIRRRADQILQLGCGRGPIRELAVRQHGEDCDGQCTRQLTQAKRLLAAAMEYAIVADLDGLIAKQRVPLVVTR